MEDMVNGKKFTNILSMIVDKKMEQISEKNHLFHKHWLFSPSFSQSIKVDMQIIRCEL